VAYRGILPDRVLDRLSVDPVAERWQERFDDPWGQTIVLESEGRIVGFAACGPGRDAGVDSQQVGEVFVIYVAPEEWRKGYGRALLVESMELLQQAGNREVMLWVLRDNEPAKRFYEAMGFETDGGTRVKMRSDGTEMILLRYRRLLGLL
jgi:ribosomal protein S18 acetylase RimI-like enzyme